MPPTLTKHSAVPPAIARPGLARVGAWHTVAIAAVLATLAWFTLPVFVGHYNEGFQHVIVTNAHAILGGDFRGTDILYGLVNDFFLVSRFGVSLLMAGLLKLGLPAVDGFRLIMLASLIVLVGANAAILVRRYNVHPVLACLPALLFPGLFESAWFFNDNVLSAALSSAALAVFWSRLTLPATAVSAVLWGLAIACRTDAVLLAPAFALLMWFELPDWRTRIRHALVAGPIVAAVPLLLFAAFGLNFLDILPLTKRSIIAWERKDPFSHVLHPPLKAFAPPGMLALALGAVAVVVRRQWREIMLCLAVPLLYAAAYGIMLTEVRYLLPLAPFFAILMVEGARALLHATGRMRTLGIAAFAVALAACFLPPVMLPHQRLYFLSTDNDMPRPSIGRFWSPVLSMWWNGKLGAGYDAMTDAVLAAAKPGGLGVVVSTRWTPDKIVDLVMRANGFTGQRAATPASCSEIGEVFTRGDDRLLHLRAHIPLLPTERAAITWRLLGAPCVRDLGMAPSDRVLIAGQMLLMERPPGLSAPGVVPLYVPELDINPWARFIAGKSYAYYVATAPLAEVPALLAPPLDERERVGAETAIEARSKVR